MDCEKCIWGIINIFRERERDRQGRARKCGGSRKRRGRKAREDIRPVFIIALHCSLTISSPFSERGSRRVGTNGRRKSCGTCRCSRWVRPAVSSYLENLNYATVIKASSSRTCPRSRRRGRVEVVGEPTRDRGAERTSFEIPREGREFLRKNLRRFSARRGGRLFFFIISLFVPPSLPLVLSLLLLFLDRE